MASDPYATLGVSATASDAELRSAYRKLVLRHHPDHNGGSAESARKFEQVQEAYAEVRRLRAVGGTASARAGGTRAAGSSRPAASPPGPDPDLDSRLADIERELREANAARERSRRAAREAAAAARAQASSGAGRATDEELGYVTTDDSFTKILSDVRDELFGKVEEARESPAAKRVADLIDDVAAKLRGE